MAAGKFEENIQKELNALKLPPTAQVWEKVEAQIRKEKKRRFFLFFLISLFAFFIAGLFWLNGKDKQSGASIKSMDTNTAILTKSNVAAIAQNKDDVKNNYAKLNVETDSENISIAKHKPVAKSKPTIKLQQQAIETATEEADIINKLPKKRTIKGRVKFTTKAADIDETVNWDEKNKDSITDPVKIEIPEKSAPANDSSSQQKMLVIKDTSTNKPIDKQTVKNKTATHKWSFGYTFGIDRGTTFNGYANTRAPQSLSSGGNTSAFPGSFPSFSSTANVVAGIGFDIGAFAEHKISDKTNLSIGLSYRLLSTILKVPSGSAALFLNTGQGLSQYHNYFHFIELPVKVQSKIGHSNQLPLYWSAGFVFSELLSANALQFSTTNGHYYLDNTLFNKTGIGLSAGLFFSIGQNGKMPFQMGPDFYYSLTKTANAGAYDEAHYNFIGIRLKKSITKK